MKESLMERLKAFLLKKEQQTLIGIPASQTEIMNAKRQLHIQLHTDYVEFITAFGGAYAGIAVHAFSNGSSIGNETVVNLTLDFPQQFFDYLPPNILATSYVISMDGEGNPIFIESSGKVYICFHDSGEVKRLANSFKLLIEENFYEW